MRKASVQHAVEKPIRKPGKLVSNFASRACFTNGRPELAQVAIELSGFGSGRPDALTLRLNRFSKHRRDRADHLLPALQRFQVASSSTSAPPEVLELCDSVNFDAELAACPFEV